MKEQDKSRFVANITWFNQLFEGLRLLYEAIFDLLPAEFFTSEGVLYSSNFYFPRPKVAPSIPPYYALMLEGRKYALQVVSVIDAKLFKRDGLFEVEPSVIVVMHTQAEKYGWVGEYALNVIKHQRVEFTETTEGICWGKVRGRYPADFFAFQVQYDRFTDSDLKPAVQKYIINPINDGMERGF